MVETAVESPAGNARSGFGSTQGARLIDSVPPTSVMPASPVGELFAFVAANPAEARQVLGPHPWSRVTDAHAAGWFRQVTRIPHHREFNDEHYVDDRALAQIPAALPLLALPRTEQMPITCGDGQQITAYGFDDPQSMRMILLQILTGRRASEIRTCRFDCLSPVPDSALDPAEGEQIARFHYAQSKIDIAPDTILVDREVVAVIDEQRQWVREQFPDIAPRHLFLQRTGNRRGDKPYPSGTYAWMLRELSKIVKITDSKGRLVGLSHTHRVALTNSRVDQQGRSKWPSSCSSGGPYVAAGKPVVPSRWQATPA